MPTLVGSVRKPVFVSRDSFDSIGRSASVYFKKSKQSERASVLKDNNSVKPRWLVSRQSTVGSLSDLEDLDVSSASWFVESDEEPETESQDTQSEEICMFWGERMRILRWNMEVIADNIADYFGANDEGKQSHQNPQENSVHGSR